MRGRARTVIMAIDAAVTQATVLGARRLGKLAGRALARRKDDVIVRIVGDGGIHILPRDEARVHDAGQPKHGVRRGDGERRGHNVHGRSVRRVVHVVPNVAEKDEHAACDEGDVKELQQRMARKKQKLRAVDYPIHGARTKHPPRHPQHHARHIRGEHDMQPADHAVPMVPRRTKQEHIDERASHQDHRYQQRTHGCLCLCPFSAHWRGTSPTRSRLADDCHVMCAEKCIGKVQTGSLVRGINRGGSEARCAPVKERLLGVDLPDEVGGWVGLAQASIKK